MGKIKIKTLGSEEEEKKQKELIKVKREQKQLRMGLKQTSDAVDESTKLTDEDLSVSEEGGSEDDNVKKTKKKKVVKKARGKRYLSDKKTVDNNKKYKLDKAVELLRSFGKTKFDESVELHLTTVDTGIKGEVSLPHGTGKTLRVVVFDDDLVGKLEKGVVDFDVLISNPSMMPKLVKFAKLLGPRGLMPNPKQGTVTEDTDKALKKFSKGLLQFKTEAKFPLIHLAVGKRSFEDSQIIENIKAFVTAVGKSKIRTMHLASTMSPSIEVSVESI